MATTTNYGWETPDDTDLVKDGAAAIRTLGSSIDTTMFTMVPKSIVDAKGDLISATADNTPARLAVGNNGETLVADSTAATGLKWAKSPNFIGVQCNNSAQQTIANVTFTALTWNGEEYDTSSFHSTSSNNSRITIPTGLGGYYRISGNVRFVSNGTGRRLVQLRKNGGMIKETEVTPGASAELSLWTNCVLPFVAGDYLEIYVYQSSGGNLNIYAGGDQVWFEAQYLGA